MAENEKKELATSRLLDLLRSQEIGESGDTSEQPKKTKSPQTEPEIPDLDNIQDSKISSVEKVDNKKSSDDSRKEKTEAKSAQKNKKTKKAKIEDSVTEAGSGEDDIVQHVNEEPGKESASLGNSQDLLKVLQGGIKKQDSHQKSEAARPTEIKNDLISESPVKETLNKPQAAMSSDKQTAERVMGEIRTQESGSEILGKEHIPDEFDSTLLAPMIKPKEVSKSIKFLEYFYKKLDQNTHEITLYRGFNVLFFMEIKKNQNGIFLNNFKKFLLPFETEERSIHDMDDLINHVLKSEIDKNDLAKVFISYISDGVAATTKKFDAPKLKHKEFLDLIQWTGKKNLPFDVEKATLDWLIYPGEKNAINKEILIGACNKETLKSEIKMIESMDLNVRYVSTIPALQWKLFLKNYPDRRDDCVILVHIGEKGSTVTLVKNNKLLYSRNITIGIDNFLKAVQQRIVEGNETIQIDQDMAREILNDYGFPEDVKGLVPGTKIKLYKLSIFMRPVLEKLGSEINRSLSFFKKENTSLEWEDILFTGRGAGYPNIIKLLGKNLGLKSEILHPNRTLYFQPQEKVMQDRELADYALNFALSLSGNPVINVLPATKKSNLKFILFSNIMLVASALLIPFFIISTVISGFTSRSLEKEINTINQDWNTFSADMKEYYAMSDDINIWKSYGRYMKNDRIYSKNQMALLKLISATVPESIKLTLVEFKRVLTNPTPTSAGIGIDRTTNFLVLTGFVSADPSVADIEYTNFVMRLESLKEFITVKSDVDQNNESSDRLFFNISLVF